MKKKTKIMQKAASGLQRIQADNASTRSLVSGGVAAGVDALFPGAGAGVGLLEGISSSLKDENGLYKSKAGQVLDNLNPVTALTTSINSIGGIFSGKSFRSGFDPTGQNDLREAIKKQKIQDQRAATWNTATSDVASNSQLSQYKGGSKAVGTKAIEIEGGEPHFSKKVGGKRVLKSFSPNGPSHEQGGISVLAEQGDAIVTAKGSLGAKAVAAHQSGDHAEVERIIDKMPADKKTAQKKRGVRKVTPAVDNTLTASQRAAIKFTPKPSLFPDELWKMPNTVSDRARQIGQPFRDGDVSMDIYNKNNKAYLPTSATGTGTDMAAIGTKASGVLSGLATAAPSIYNLGQGLFGDVAKTTRRTYNPTTMQYEDSSGATRQAITQGLRGSISNARNVSGGNAGNVRANTAQAYAQSVSQNAEVNSQEAARKLQVGNTNVGIQNDAKLRNIAMNDRADELDLMNAAKKTEALSKGLEGISGLAQNSQLMANQKAASDASVESLGQMYRNMQLVNGKWVVRKARKGIKKVK